MRLFTSFTSVYRDCVEPLRSCFFVADPFYGINNIANW